MDLQRAKELLSDLADGVDPLTGEVLPEDHVCNKAEIIRAFHCVLKSLPGKASKPQPENAGGWGSRMRDGAAKPLKGWSRTRSISMFTGMRKMVK